MSLHLSTKFKYLVFRAAFFIIYGYITRNNQPLLGLIAQLIEHCPDIAEVMGLNPTQA